ncbi:MAG: hypothetical protein WA902_01355, partial [Thermosynechococcaceae cyanobacterium]
MSQSLDRFSPRYLPPASTEDVRPVPHSPIGLLRAILLGLPLLFSSASSHLQLTTVALPTQAEVVQVNPDLLSLPESQEQFQPTASPTVIANPS